MTVPVGRLPRIRPIPALAAIAMSAALSLVVVTGSAQASAAASPPGCLVLSLSVSVHTKGAAAGSVYDDLVFRNISRKTCTLYGFPGVSIVRGTRHVQIGSAAKRVYTIPKRLVVLSPGRTAMAQLQVTQAANYPPSVCNPRSGTGFKIYPPGDRGARVVTYRVTGCVDDSVDLLSVQVVT